MSGVTIISSNVDVQKSHIANDVEDMYGRRVKNLQGPGSTAKERALKVLAVIIQVVAAAVLLASIALGLSMIPAVATALPFLATAAAPVLGVLSIKWAIVASSIAGFLGLSHLIGGIMLWKRAPDPQPVFDPTDVPLSRHDLDKILGDREVDVRGKHLNTVHKAIYMCKNAESINLSNNHIKYLPANFCDYFDLYSLDVSRNRLSALPSNIDSLSNLQILNVAKNELKELPSGLFKLKELEALDVSKNKLTKISSDIGNLSSLQMLSVAKTGISTLPSSMSKLKELVELDVSGNPNLKQIPDFIGQLPKLKTLKFSSDQTAPKNARAEIVNTAV